MFQCPFAKACWQYICPPLNILDDDSHFDNISKIRTTFNRPFFMDIHSWYRVDLDYEKFLHF
jgi:hypothetical protein